jgi:hypothetical protein
MGDEELEIVVEKIMGKKQVAVSGSHHLGETEKLRKLIEEYEDLILELNDVNGSKKGLERIWESGKIITERIDPDDKKDLDDILRYCPDITYSGTRSLYRWKYFYQLFPEKDYREDFSWSIYTEFCSAKPDEGTRKAYDKVADLDEQPPSFSIRTWRKFRDENKLSEEEIVRYAVKNASNSILNTDESEIKEGIKTALDLLNAEKPLDEDLVGEVIDEFQNQERELT